jgi:outer membrane protein OmpA-like peptidoglycan-associated protein
MKKNSDSFWPSYTDLMTSLFFIMLVLYVLTYVRLNSTIKLQKEKLAIIEAVEQTLKPLKKEKSLFVYEEEYKRFKLAFNVKFATGKSEINNQELENFETTISKIDQAGYKLKNIIDTLNKLKNTDKKLKNVSYILVLAGYASRNGTELENYKLSYLRSLNLKNYWKNKGINFESEQYNGLIDLQISGNGWGGVGRIMDFVHESDNQRFLIQIFPKIGNLTND